MKIIFKGRLDKNAQKACGRAVSNYFMLTGFIPYARSIMGKDQVWIEAEDEKEMVLRQAEKKFHKWFNMYLLKYLSALIHGQSSIDEIKQHIQEEEFIRIIRDPDMLSSDLKTVIAKISFLPADWKAITH